MSNTESGEGVGARVWQCEGRQRAIALNKNRRTIRRNEWPAAWPLQPWSGVLGHIDLVEKGYDAGPIVVLFDKAPGLCAQTPRLGLIA